MAEAPSWSVVVLCVEQSGSWWYLFECQALDPLADLIGISIGLTLLTGVYRTAADIVIRRFFPELFTYIEEKGDTLDDEWAAGEAVSVRRTVRLSAARAAVVSAALLSAALFASFLVVPGGISLPRIAAWALVLAPIAWVALQTRSKKNREILQVAKQRIEQRTRWRDDQRHQSVDNVASLRESEADEEDRQEVHGELTVVSAIFLGLRELRVRVDVGERAREELGASSAALAEGVCERLRRDGLAVREDCDSELRVSVELADAPSAAGVVELSLWDWVRAVRWGGEVRQAANAPVWSSHQITDNATAPEIADVVDALVGSFTLLVKQND